MNYQIAEFNQADWNQLVTPAPDLSLMQLWEYGEAKKDLGPWQVIRAIFKENNQTVGAVQATLRPIPLFKKGLVWIARGPLVLVQENQEALREQMLQELKKYWVDQKKMYLRIASTVPYSENNLQTVQSAGFNLSSQEPGWTSSLIDLTQPIETLRMNLDKKWRNCLNKAERLNLQSQKNSDLNQFQKDYEQLLAEKKFTTSAQPELFKKIQTLLPEQNKLLVFSATLKQQHLGTILVALYAKTGFYLAGAINSEGRKMNATNFLLWQALINLKEQGYILFDLGGAHPIRTPAGILHFKQGLNGQNYQFIDEIESYPDSFLYKLINKALARRI